MINSTIYKSFISVFVILIYSFGVANAQDTLAFHLDFESGDGIPTDRSSFGYTVNMNGAAEYVSDAVYGDYAFRFDASDGTSLEITGAELASETVTVDFFFKTDTLDCCLWLVNKAGELDNHGDYFHRPNYGIIVHNPDGVIGGLTWDTGGDNPTGLNQRSGDEGGEEMLQIGKWYNAIFVVAQDTQFFQLRNTSGDILGEGGYTPQGPPPTNPNQPLRIGDADPDADPPINFEGLMDDFRVYNYARITADGSYNPPDRTSTAIPGEGEMPSTYKLNHNYPNPFNPSTRISYSLPTATDVTLKVYNAVGQHMTTLVNQKQSAGQHTTVWNAGNASSGVYYYTIQAGDYTETRSMTLIK